MDTDFLQSCWQKGIDHFNEAEFWDAHEDWEAGWKLLPIGPLKLSIQAWIQAASVFHLLKMGRVGGAESLLKSALVKLGQCEADTALGVCPIQIDELIPILQALRQNWPPDPLFLDKFINNQVGKSVRARLLLSPL